MNIHTPHQMQFVLYSTNELVAGDGAGFWSNDDGWVEFKFATKFTLANVPSCNLPITAGQDAKWIMWEPAAMANANGTKDQLQIRLPMALSH